MKKLLSKLSAFVLSIYGAVITAFADETAPGGTLTGTEEISGFIGMIKNSATEIAIGIIAIAIVGVAITLVTSRDGLEKAKSKIVAILVAAAVLLFGEGIILGVLG